MTVSNILKNDAFTCKEWSNAEMIQCADTIIAKAVSGFDCQLPMSMKIGINALPYVLTHKPRFLVNFFNQNLGGWLIRGPCFKIILTVDQ